MSAPDPDQSSHAPPEFWRSLAERAGAPEFESSLAHEFPHGATLWPNDLDRRQFLKLLGGSLALAGLAGCGPKGDQIIPFVAAPSHPVRPEGSDYATAMPVEGFGRGVLVRSHLGRPTKIEGNPDHAESRGATDAITQAAVLSLYDPDRSRTPRRAGQPQAWLTFADDWLERQQRFTAGRGRGVALLLEPTTSPTVRREVHRLLDALPEARWYQHTPLARYDLDGRQPDFDFGAADVVFSIGGDWFGQHPAALRYARAFATRRRIEHGRVRLARFYVLEPTPSVTGTLADFRLPASPGRTRLILDAVADALDSSHGAPAGLTTAEANFVEAVARDLRAHATGALCAAGPEQDADIQRWAWALNARLGSAPRLQRFTAPVRSDGDPRAAGGLAELVEAIDRGEISTLCLAETNPVYSAPADIDFAAALRRVPYSVHLGPYLDETAVACTWHLPQSHFLEAWGDLRGYDGTATIQQPLISPLFPSRSLPELLRLFTEPTGRSGYDVVRESWRAAGPAAALVDAWAAALDRGVVGPELATTDTPGAPATAAAPAGTDLLRLSRAAPPAGITLVLQPDSSVLDGRYANSPWLQELPRPVTRIVWDNAVLISPALADRLRLSDGDRIEIAHAEPPGENGGTAGAQTSGTGASNPAAPLEPEEGAKPAPSAGGARRTLEAAVLILPGQAPDCITLTLGYGRTRAGTVGNRHGFNAYRLRTRAAAWVVDDVAIRRLEGHYPFVTTQGHFTMAGRDIVRVVFADRLQTAPKETPPSLYPTWPRDEYAWGMSIDLSTCTGCSACVVACQAENNIPSVGKDQVARGREMLWLRVDRYFSGDPANPRMVAQPVPCMQCENAPCELVCPVGATVHSSEGLNDMVYNRCVGTRYCSNNCPYKVRRFNFLDYRAPGRSPVHLQENPDVSVRARGVMEKCTYCVQRIDAARIAAERENRRVRDGEVVPACQQACPVEAIVFGDLNDPTSRVNQRKHEPLDYRLYEELNTRPRTSYLAKIIAVGATGLEPGPDRRETSRGNS